MLGQLDNADLWEIMGQVVSQRPGVVSLRKVKARVSNYDHQSQELTVGNTRADLLAKSCAKESYESRLGHFTLSLHRLLRYRSTWSQQ